MLMMRKETGGAGMEEESWAAGLGWEKLIPVTPQHLDIYTLDTSPFQISPLFSGIQMSHKRENKYFILEKSSS